MNLRLKKMTLVITCTLLFMRNSCQPNPMASFATRNKMVICVITGALCSLTHWWWNHASKDSSQTTPQPNKNKKNYSKPAKSLLFGSTIGFIAYHALSFLGFTHCKHNKSLNSLSISPREGYTSISLHHDILEDFPISNYTSPYRFIPGNSKRAEIFEKNYKDGHDGYTGTVKIYKETKAKSTNNSHNTTFEVWNLDTCEAAKKLLPDKPAVLDMANEISPGGGPEKGFKAQEEQLCYRSPNLFTALARAKQTVCGDNWLQNNMHKNPFISEFGALYIPQIKVIRDSENKGYALYQPEECFSIDIIASAAYDLSWNKKKSSSYQNGTKEKIRTQLRVALDNGHSAILLSAFGCGAFKNDPKEIAEFYKEIFNEPEFRGTFKKVVFSIFGGGENFNVFKQTLKSI